MIHVNNSHMTIFFHTGETYFINPNGGSIADSIEVTCKNVNDMWFTCIKPSEMEIVSSNINAYLLFSLQLFWIDYL